MQVLLVVKADITTFISCNVVWCKYFEWKRAIAGHLPRSLIKVAIFLQIPFHVLVKIRSACLSVVAHKMKTRKAEKCF